MNQNKDCQNAICDIVNDNFASDIAKTFTQDNGNVEIHCWDGKRYLLSRMEDGNRYNSQTGMEIVK